MTDNHKFGTGQLSRREALALLAGASAGAVVMGGFALAPPVQAAQRIITPLPKHAPVMVGGKRIKTVDVHCHINVPEVPALLKGTPLDRVSGGTANAVATGNPLLEAGGERLLLMDKNGIDVQVLSINPFWYAADRDLAARLMDFQNRRLVEMVAAAPAGRFAAFAAVALQFPDLAAKQLEEGMKMGLKGAAIGGSVEGEEISGRKYDLFWAKAEELQAPIFMHPQGSADVTGITKRVGGIGNLSNVIGNPLETTIFLSHMIFDGTLERFPRLKLCAAHGGGYLPSYPDRMDHGCLVFPDQCKGSTLKKKPTEYLKQVYIDSLVFAPEALHHLVVEMGASHIMLGTDYPFLWTERGAETMGPVDHLFATPGLSDAEKIAILGGNACQLLNIPA